jgi:hypothetical protein
VSGVARDAEDIAEFAKRLNLSDFFAKVRFLPAKAGKDKLTDLEVVRFALEAEVKY